MNTPDRQTVLAHYQRLLKDCQRDAAIRGAEAEREQADKLLKADPDYPIHHDDWTAGNEHDHE